MTTVQRRRSALFMPASNVRAMTKVRTLPCDIVILDLEDAVAPHRKQDVREQAATALREGFGPRESVLRINGVDTAWYRDDLALASTLPVDAVLLPKVSSITDVAGVRVALGPTGPRIWAMIESARGVMALPALADAAATLGLTVLVAGTNDLALDLQCRPGIDRSPLLPALAQIVAAARAGGMMALDGVLNAIDDSERLEAECIQGRNWGFDGKTLIHPTQIDAANRAYGPSSEELGWAIKVIAAFADPAAADRGAIKLDGAMVERLHLAEAERIVARAG